MFRMKGWPVVFTLGSCVAMAGCGQRKVPEGKGKDKAAVPVPAITATAPSESKASNAAAAGVTLYSAKGSALVSEGGKFTVADKGASINPGTRVVSAGGAVLISNGVEVELLADLSGNDPMPVATSGLKVSKTKKPPALPRFALSHQPVTPTTSSWLTRAPVAPSNPMAASCPAPGSTLTPPQKLLLGQLAVGPWW